MSPRAWRAAAALVLVLWLTFIFIAIGCARAMAATSIGAQDPGSMKSGQTADSFAAGHEVGARFWRVIVNAKDPIPVGVAMIRSARAAGFEPVVTVGGAFAGGVPSVRLLAAVAPLARYFTVYNEPDYDHVSVPDYRSMFAAARDTLRTVNPRARVLVCDCTAQGAEYLASVRAAGPLANDGIAWHPYTRNFGKPSTAARDIAAVKREARRWRVRRLWATEFGFPPDRPAAYWGTMARRLRTAGVTAAFAYHMRGTATAAWDTALLNPDGSPRAALRSLAAFTTKGSR